MNRIVALAFLLMTVFPISAIKANNNYFLPGDAFFYAELEHEWFANNLLEDAPIIEYTRPFQGGRFCGYAGYRQVTLGKLTPEMRAALQKAYEQLRRHYPLVVQSNFETTFEVKDGKLVEQSRKEVERFERNPVRMLIYNREFDLARFRPCFRYNENWADAAARFGHPRDHVAYDFFVGDPASIEEDWRDAALVAPLRFSSDNPELEGPRLLDQMISVDCQDIQILLFPGQSPRELAFPQPTVEFTTRDVNGPTLGGGIFNVQDQSDLTNAQDDEQDEEEQDESVPFVGYRVIGNQLEILNPQAEHWIPSPVIVLPEFRDPDKNDD